MAAVLAVLLEEGELEEAATVLMRAIGEDIAHEDRLRIAAEVTAWLAPE